MLGRSCLDQSSILCYENMVDTFPCLSLLPRSRWKYRVARRRGEVVDSCNTYSTLPPWLGDDCIPKIFSQRPPSLSLFMVTLLYSSVYRTHNNKHPIQHMHAYSFQFHVAGTAHLCLADAHLCFLHPNASYSGFQSIFPFEGIK